MADMMVTWLKEMLAENILEHPALKGGFLLIVSFWTLNGGGVDYNGFRR